MGFAIAENLANLGAEVTLITGPVHLSISNPNIHPMDIVTADEMYAASIEVFPNVDCAILSAAVADYKPSFRSPLKIKKSENEDLVIRLEKNKDILFELGKVKKPNQVLVGFSLETHNEEEFALEKLKKKNCDFIVLNSLNTKGAGFAVDTNQITILDAKQGKISFSLKTKKEVAKDIIDFLIKNYL